MFCVASREFDVPLLVVAAKIVFGGRMFSACAPVSAEWAATHDISSHVEILHFFHLVSGNFYSSFLNQLVEFRSSLVMSF
jgi:hypothetical protein